MDKDNKQAMQVGQIEQASKMNRELDGIKEINWMNHSSQRDKVNWVLLGEQEPKEFDWQIGLTEYIRIKLTERTKIK